LTLHVRDAGLQHHVDARQRFDARSVGLGHGAA
jgi:hypothetical protein